MSLPVVGKAHEARAAAQAFHWFIYGSSLDRAAFGQWAEQHGYRVPDFSRAVPARLADYRLAFDVQSKFWGGAVGSLVPAPGSFVEGIALPLPPEARGLVDHKEGTISGLYIPLEVKVQPLAAGVAEIDALAFVSAPGRRLSQEQKPSPGFVGVLQKGAADWQLSAEYQAVLAQLGA